MVQDWPAPASGGAGHSILGLYRRRKMADFGRFSVIAALQKKALFSASFQLT
jgi:hypothetical protein